jgi:uncharacterized protein (TIGR02145 family)
MKETIFTLIILLTGIKGLSQVKDIDGNEYKTVKIGQKEWMAENLNVSHFRNGDKIPQAKTAEEWEKANKDKKPVWMYLNFTEENKRYPKLYNWHALHDSRGIAPMDWRVCSEEDVKDLISSIGSIETAGKKLKSSTGWESETGENGTDDFGFSGSQTGSYNPWGNYDGNAQNASWWTSSIKLKNHESGEPDLALGFYLLYFSDALGIETPSVDEGRAIRCVKSN